MLETAALVFWLVAGVGFVMVVAAAISRIFKRLLRLSDEAVADPWYRRTDTSGLSWAIHWMRPGLFVMSIAASIALLLEALT